MKSLLLIAAVVALMPATRAILPPTNPARETEQGRRAFAAGQYGQALRHFEEAEALRNNARNSFNRGTAEIAAGDRAAGERRLEESMSEPQLRAAALYNRARAAIEGREYDRAVDDLQESLRIAPNDLEAKRNLEIALRRSDQRQQQRRQSGDGGGQQPDDQPGEPGEEQDQPSQPDEGEPEREGGRPDLESLLRAVQQQENEELSRMRRGREERRRVGW
jgi:tetratricopeptide (TPR) repeat protein